MSQKSCYYVLYSSYFYATVFLMKKAFLLIMWNNKELSNEAEDDMKNYAGQGGYYHPR